MKETKTLPEVLKLLFNNKQLSDDRNQRVRISSDNENTCIIFYFFIFI